jgi:hypothetical protein
MTDIVLSIINWVSATDLFLESRTTGADMIWSAVAAIKQTRAILERNPYR